MNELVNHPTSVEYFWPDVPVGHVQDDHLPFLNRGNALNTANMIPTVNCAALLGDHLPVPLCQVCASSTSSRRPSRLCGTRLMTTSRTWIAPPFRTSTRSCRFLSWSTSTSDQPSPQPSRTPREENLSQPFDNFLMFHCKIKTTGCYVKDWDNRLFLMLYKRQQYLFLGLIIETWGWGATLRIRWVPTADIEKMCRDARCWLHGLFFFYLKIYVLTCVGSCMYMLKVFSCQMGS